MSDSTTQTRQDRTVTVDIRLVLGVTERNDVEEGVSAAEYAEWVRNVIDGLRYHRDDDTGHPAIESIEVEGVEVGPAMTHPPGDPY